MFPRQVEGGLEVGFVIRLDGDAVQGAQAFLTSRSESRPRRSTAIRALHVSRCQSCGTSATSSARRSSIRFARGSSSSSGSHAKATEASTTIPRTDGAPHAALQVSPPGEGDAPPCRAALSEALHCLLACGVVLRKSRDQVRDRLAMSRYSDGLPALDRPEEFGQARFGFGTSNFAISTPTVVLTIPFHRRPSEPSRRRGSESPGGHHAPAWTGPRRQSGEEPAILRSAQSAV